MFRISMLKNETILIVEDDHYSGLALELHFNELGYNVILFNNGEELFRNIDSVNLSDITYLIYDINLPKINGVELLKLTRTFFPNAKYLLTSGYSDYEVCGILGCEWEDFKRFLEIYNITYFEKPFNINDVFQLIEG